MAKLQDNNNSDVFLCNSALDVNKIVKWPTTVVSCRSLLGAERKVNLGERSD